MAPNSSIMHNESGFFSRWLMIAAPDLNLPGPINAAAFTAVSNCLLTVLICSLPEPGPVIFSKPQADHFLLVRTSFIKFRNSPLHRCHPHRGYFEFVYHHTAPTGPKLKASVKGGLYSSSSSIGPYKPNLHGSNALRLRRSSLF